MKENILNPRSLNITALALFALISGAPVAGMLIRSVWVNGDFTLLHYADVFSSRHYAGLMARSLGIATSATALAVVIGSLQAFLLVRTDLCGNSLWRRIYLLPLCIPPHVHAISWIFLFGETGLINRTLSGISGTVEPVFNIYTEYFSALILAVAYHPLVTLMAISGLLSMDRRMEDAARQYHPITCVLGKVTLPIILPHIVSGALLVFIFTFYNYGVPSLLQVHTFPVEIFAQFSAFYNEAAATALAVPFLGIALVLLALQRFWMQGRSFVVLDTGQNQAGYLHLGKIQRLTAPFMVVLFSVAVGLPFLVLAWQSKSIATFGTIWRITGSDIVFTTVLSLTASTIIIVLAFMLCGIFPGRRASSKVEFLFLAPLAFPAVVLGIGLIYVWNRPATQMVYSSAMILIIAYTARFLPFSIQAVIAGNRQIAAGLREAAALYCGTWWKRSIKIELPLLLPALVAGWSIAFILCMGELAATLLVVPPGMGTIALKIYTLMHYGANQMVAALSLILISINLFTAGFAILAARILGRSQTLMTFPGEGDHS